MAARPPGGGNTDEPEAIEFGIAALDARLEETEVTYPVSAAELDDEHGHVEVPFDPAGHTVTVGEALAEVNEKTFDSQADLLNALHPVFERKRQAASNSLLAQLRALVPF